MSQSVRCSPRRDQLVEAIQPAIGHRREHPQRTVPATRIADAGVIASGSQRGARRAPTCPTASSIRRPPGLAPDVRFRATARYGARPPTHFLAEAQAADKPDFAVDREQFAMIAGEPAEGTVEPRRIEPPDLASGVLQRAPQPGAAGTQIAEPVVYGADANPGSRALGHRRHELTPYMIVGDDVVVEEDVVLCGTDRLQPRRIVLRGVLQHAYLVAADERRPRRA